MPERNPAIYSALFANLLIAVTKFIAAAVTGSSAMVSEGIHSVVDTSNEILLLLGIKKSKKPPDDERPFGYGKELYFWAFIVSILIFGVGGGLSFYEGITHISHPEIIRDPFWNYIVLGCAFVFDGTSFIIALRQFNRQRKDKPFWKAVKESRDPSSFVVLFEDAADVTGLVIAFAGVYLGHAFQNPYFDGIASILIGILLTSISALLAVESRSLLMGETASEEVLKQVRKLIEENQNVVEVKELLSMVMAPRETLLLLRITFDAQITANSVQKASEDIKKTIRDKYPFFRQIFVEVVK